MKRSVALFLIFGVVGCSRRAESPQSALRDVERSSFADAYREWRKEKESLAKNRVSNGSYVIPTGVTDTETGKFTPSRIVALQCRLGQEAHLHESFLLNELAADAAVHRILESSQRLCEKYGVVSTVQVQFAPGHGYVHKARNGCSPQFQQALWLKGMNNLVSQQDDAASGR